MNAEYEKFLKAVAANPHLPHTPTPVADAAWHAHILDTRDYAKMCQERFGAFLHHDPATGAGYCASVPVGS